jgi:hypothetical protein
MERELLCCRVCSAGFDSIRHHAKFYVLVGYGPELFAFKCVNQALMWSGIRFFSPNVESGSAVLPVTAYNATTTSPAVTIHIPHDLKSAGTCCTRVTFHSVAGGWMTDVVTGAVLQLGQPQGVIVLQTTHRTISGTLLCAHRDT